MSQQAPPCPSASEAGTNYFSITTATNGLNASICNPSGYAGLLNDVADGHPREGATHFVLSEVPDVTTLAVDELIAGVVLNHYDNTQLTYDAVTMEVILPVGVSGHSEVVIWYAPAP